MYRLYLIGFDGTKQLVGIFGNRRKARRTGEKMKQAGLGKKYRVKRRHSPKALRAARRS